MKILLAIAAASLALAADEPKAPAKTEDAKPLTQAQADHFENINLKIGAVRAFVQQKRTEADDAEQKGQETIKKFIEDREAIRKDTCKDLGLAESCTLSIDDKGKWSAKVAPPQK